LIAIGAVAAGLFIAASRYADRAGRELTEAAHDGSGVTIRFARNPQPIAAFSLPDLAGATIDTAAWRGKVTMVNFWGTWCPPCRAEIPDLIALQRRYADGLQIIGIADDVSDAVVLEFARQHGINYRLAMITDELRSAFRIRALPTTVIVDREGRVVQKHVGLQSPVVLEQEVRALLDLPIQAKVETFEDVGQVSLTNAAHATEIPGLDLTSLAPAAKTAVLLRLNAEHCTCGCKLTVAECRVNDPACTVSLPLARSIVEQVAARP
jgi:thiol-disulfide isomerase/thioredoxin